MWSMLTLDERTTLSRDADQRKRRPTRRCQPNWLSTNYFPQIHSERRQMWLKFHAIHNQAYFYRWCDLDRHMPRQRVGSVEARASSAVRSIRSTIVVQMYDLSSTLIATQIPANRAHASFVARSWTNKQTIFSRFFFCFVFFFFHSFNVGDLPLRIIDGASRRSS